MKLLNKFENFYYEVITKMLYEPPMNEKEARKFIEDNIDIKVDFKIVNNLLSKKEESKCWLFSYNEANSKFYPVVKKEMPIILNSIELDALNNIIDMDISEGFLKESTINNIKKNLKSRKPGWSIDNIKYKRQYSDGDKNNIDEINLKLKILLKAIRKKCAIKCDNITRKNIIYKDQQIFPLKIEYSTINDKFRLYCFKIEDNQKKYIKMNISGLENLKLEEDIIREKDKEFIQNNIENTKKVVLYVDPEKHVLERCFRLFSFYERQASYDRRNNRYILEINYYIYDETDVIKNILSLGSRVVVKSPDDIKQTILSRVKKSVSNYKK